MEQTFQDRLAKETGQVMWQIALCYHVGFGTARDAREAFEFARMAKSSGHPVAAIFSYLLASPEELGPHQSRESYATRVLALLRSDPAASVGMPPLVEAFYQGDESTVHSLFDQTACLCSSTVDNCSPLHWLFAFQNEKALDGIVDRFLKTDDGHLAGLVNLPFSAPKEIHCQWPLKLFGSPLAVAISVNSLITVKALLALGADPFLHIYHEAKPNPEDQGQHWTAFHIAAKYHCSEILQYLVEHSDPDRHAELSPLGCALTLSTSIERLAMHGLGRMEQLDHTVRIIKSIQPLTAVALNGMTALMQAIDFQDHDVAASLLRAVPELANTPFFSPRDNQVFNLPIHFAAQIASQRDSLDTLEIPDLINSYTQELSASVAPSRDHAGRTPLHFALTGPSNQTAAWILQRKGNMLHVEDTWD
jgi:ankyrin repeat protein